QGPPETYSRTLADRIGYAARQGLAQPSLSIDPTAAPLINPNDMTTVDIEPSLQSPSVEYIGLPEQATLQAEAAQLVNGINPSSPSNAVATLTEAAKVTRRLLIADEIQLAQTYSIQGAQLSSGFAAFNKLVAYSDRPKIILAISNIQTSADYISTNASISLD